MLGAGGIGCEKMKQKDIKVGKIYTNSGAGTTFRKVVSIEVETEENRPHWWSSGPRPEGMPVVVYKDYRTGNIYRLYLKSFAQWAGSEVVEP